MNKPLLKQRVRDATGSNAMLDELRNLLDISENSLVAKTNGKREFKPSEIDKMRIAYKLSADDVIEIFIRQEEQK